jgi:transposase
VLDDLARVVPEWLLSQISRDWFDRYRFRFERCRLPEQKAEQAALQRQIGQDGAALLRAIYREAAPSWLRELPAVEVMRRIWIQQYYTENDQIRWREDEELPSYKLLIVSPDDLEARNRTKRETNWSGYAAHLTETCSPTEPNLITNVETTPATTADVEMTDTIHQHLSGKELLPEEHLVDAGYVAVDQLHNSRQDYQIDLIGPIAGGGSWQANQGHGFDVSCFVINWDSQTVSCPQGKLSQSWHTRREKYGHDYIQVRFAPADCRACPHRPKCTTSKRGVRALSFKPKAEYETLQWARQRQETDEFKVKYKQRAGIEGTISQGTRAFGLRRSRYLGLAKTHLQHLATAAAINLTRVISWWMSDESKPPVYQPSFAALAPVT